MVICGTEDRKSLLALVGDSAPGRTHHLSNIRERDLSLRLSLPPHYDCKRGSLPAGLHHGADRAVSEAKNRAR
jgi:hypothetical protein